MKLCSAQPKRQNALTLIFISDNTMKEFGDTIPISDAEKENGQVFD